MGKAYYDMLFKKALDRLRFYAVGFGGYLMPRGYYRARRSEILGQLTHDELVAATRRAAYYCRLPEDAPSVRLSCSIGELTVPYRKQRRFPTYFFDLYSILRYFPDNLRFDHVPGDIRRPMPTPTFVKSRPITDTATNSTILKLDSLRHYQWADADPLHFDEKLDMIVSRNQADQQWRQEFLSKYIDHPRCDIGHTARHPIPGHPEWSKEFLSIAEHLKFKFISCIEGWDVATNLKWVMSSRSLAVMPRPKCESWFAEGLLEGGVQFVEIADDYSDLIEKLDYYASRPRQAEEIIENAHRYIAPFRNQRLELATQLLTAERYFSLTGQL